MPGASEKKQAALRVINIVGPFVVLLFVTLFFALIMESEVRKNFFSVYNFKLILTQTVIVAIGALGMTMIIVSGGIDLSVGSVIALTSVLGAFLIQHHFPVPLVILDSILLGALIGAINGTIIAGFAMTPFIVTLGMLGIARGAAKWLADNQTVNFPESSIALIMKDPNPFGGWNPAPGVWVALALALVMSFIMNKTVFGRHIFAIGSNEATARLCGVRTRAVKALIYAVSGILFGLAGVMQLSRLRQGDPGSAMGVELDIIAAVVIGGASLSGGTGSILGSMVGALTMAVLRSGSTQSDWPNYMQEIIIGIVIILAVGLDKWRQARFAPSS